MRHIKKNDIVIVLTGKDKGKTGKVLKIFPQQKRAIVQGITIVKKHMRKRRDEQQSGIIEMEGTIQISNLMLYCNRCSKGTRPRFTVLADKTKARSCHVCGENI